MVSLPGAILYKWNDLLEIILKDLEVLTNRVVTTVLIWSLLPRLNHHDDHHIIIINWAYFYLIGWKY